MRSLEIPRLLRPLLPVFFVAVHLCSFAADATPTIIGAGPYHLGTEGLPEWQEFEGRTPVGRRLDLKFNAEVNETEQTLFIRQYDVKLSWNVLLNGRRVGLLPTMEGLQLNAFAVPAKALKAGENTLAIVPPAANEDIIVSEIVLDPRPREQVLTHATLSITVTENGGAVPCRVTLADKHGALLPFTVKPRQSADGQPGIFAARTGVVYTRDGHAELGVRAGEYIVYATRGFEYNMATSELAIAAGEIKTVALQLIHEVPTPGLIAADTHIHTLTHSGHGDATIEERMLTIAGEGIELPVATDHNYHANYADAQLKARVTHFFTSVPGNEVTTKTAHFNIFPINKDAQLVDHKVEDWTALLKAMRGTPGVQVVTLNHPRDMHNNFIPFGPKNFNAVSGEHQRELSFDAIEVITSGALQSDIMLLYHDWMALLNHGSRVGAIASSDTHDVSRFILGQGRTYVRCNDADPAKIDIAEACRSFREGRVRASLGLLTELTVNGKAGTGDLASGLGDSVSVTVRVLGPSWITADRVEVFANDARVFEEKIAPSRNIEKLNKTFTLPRPPHDTALVAVATGPGVSAPCWALPKPYQPSAKIHESRVVGSDGPVWLDADGDGEFTPPRTQAKVLTDQHANDFAALLKALGKFDEATAIQAASLLKAAGKDLNDGALLQELTHAAAQVRSGFERFQKSIVETKP